MDISTKVHDRQKESMNGLTDFERVVFFDVLDVVDSYGGAADIKELFIDFWKLKGIDPYA